MQSSILQPAVAMFILTFIVWIWMSVVRFSYFSKNRVQPQQVATPEQMSQVLPERTRNPGNNLKSLFELPVIFYALCGYLFASGKVDAIYVDMAWSFVFFRALHSLIHCTSNIVKYRFMAYAVSSAVLWLMVARFAVETYF